MTKEQFKLYQEIEKKLSLLEKKGEIKMGKSFVKHEPGLFGELALALGIYSYPSVAYFYVDRIKKFWEEKKFFLFGKTVVRSNLNGTKIDLEKMLEPFGEEVIRNNHSIFSDFEKEDILYQVLDEPHNLVVIRGGSSKIGMPKLNYLNFLIDIHNGLYYNDLKIKHDKNKEIRV